MSRQQSLLASEKEREYAGRELERARAHLEEAKAIIQEKDRALQVAVQEKDSLKAEMAIKVAKAEVDAVQAYKNGFKDTMDYLFLMRDVVNEYKASIKRLTQPLMATTTTALYLASRPLLLLRIRMRCL